MEILISAIIGFVIAGCILWHIYDTTPVKGPMYPRYINVERPRLTVDEMQNRKNPLCPLCCRYFNVLDRPSRGQPEDLFCGGCNKKIRSYGDSFRPSYITNERDWMYLKRGIGTKFWIINGDYERGDIDAAQAARWMHGLVPEGFGKIEPIRYRESRSYAYGFQSHLDSTSDVFCQVCNNRIESCECRELYNKAVHDGKYPNTLKPYLEKLRELNPKFIIAGYYRKDGAVYANTEPRSEFAVEDYFTFDDWQAITYLLNHSRKEEFSEQIVRAAVEQYLQMIVVDLELLIKFHVARRGDVCVTVPLLPSTNPASVRTVKTTPKVTSQYDKLIKEFMG